ncbi:MAG: transposase [Actinobacteria bacterium]|nr:transposase [Actinomycetota bacterium]
MFRRIIRYSDKHFGIFNLIEDITDLRQRPQISTANISSSIVFMLISNLGSLNKFNISRDTSAVGSIAGRVPSSSTIARSADSIDLESLREIQNVIYLKARRAKMIQPCNGRWIGVVDGHEITSSDIYKCSHCSVRNISRIEEVVKLNYYHRYTAFILAGQKFCFMLDIEPIYPHEGELTSAYRLLKRVCLNYPRAFEVVVGDGLYLNGPTFSLLASHNKYAAAVLKDDTRALYEEAVSLSKITEPLVYEDEKTVYRVWEHNIKGLWKGYEDAVRVIRSEEVKEVRTHSQVLGKWELKQERTDWLWVTNLPSVVDLKSVVSICHSRWQIENRCFNEIVSTWNGDHVYRHSSNAISAFILFLFIALNIFNIFFARNIKDKMIRSKTLLIDLTKAEFLLAKWIHPIPL